MKQKLVELSVVVVIIGVLAGVAVPRFQKSKISYRSAQNRIRTLDQFINEYQPGKGISRSRFERFVARYKTEFPETTLLASRSWKNVDERYFQLEARVEILSEKIDALTSEIRATEKKQLPWILIVILLPILGWILKGLLAPLLTELGNRVKYRCFSRNRTPSS